MTTVTPSSEVAPNPMPRRRRWWFYLRRGLMVVAVLFVALVLLGVTYQTAATEIDKRTYPPRGQLYNVNGHQMHMVCMGEGSPTVILQAGGVAESLWWYWVQNELAVHTKVCAFDRPGLGWSEAVSGMRDPATILSELHALLAEANVPPPYLMAGHSYGGLLTRLYAAQYPQEIKGIVLVDAFVVGMHPQDFGDKREVDALIAQYDWLRLLLYAQTRTGLIRLANPGEFHKAGYPAPIASELTALQLRNEVMDTDFAEKVTALWALIETSAKADNLGNLPVILLWGSLSDMTKERNTALLKETFTYSSNSVTRYVEGADHLSILGTERYARQITDAVLDMIATTQTGKPLS